jgi:hypothetical protein
MSLQQERIAALCLGLKLDRLSAEWPALAQAAAADEVSYADLLEKLLSAEAAARVERTRQTLLKLATLPAAYPTLREASFRLCLAPGLMEKLLALRDGDEPEPYTQSSASVAVHLVDVRNGREVVGMTVTRGGSARSTAEPAARAAVELAEGRLSAPGVHPPEAAIHDAEAFLAQLDTELRWQ